MGRAGRRNGINKSGSAGKVKGLHGPLPGISFTPAAWTSLNPCGSHGIDPTPGLGT